MTRHSNARSDMVQATSTPLKNKQIHFIAGAVGGMTAAILTSPLEVVKTRLQLPTSTPLSTFGVMQSIVRNGMNQKM